MKLTALSCALICLLAAGFVGRVSADETARLPYLQIYKMQAVQVKWKRTQPNFRVILRMTSTTPSVKSADLKVFIQSKKENVPVKLEADGDFTIPMTDDLRDENPWIVVNQPRGTMALHWNVEFVELPEIKNPMKYRRLLDPLFDAEDLQDEMLRAFPGSPKLTFAGLKLIFPPGKSGKDAVVVIHAREGDKTLKLDDDHSVIIRRDTELLDESPEVSMPALPTKIEFAVRKPEDK